MPPPPPLKGLGVESILCSPYSRALDTIKPFVDATSVQMEVHPCLAEGQLVLDSSLKHEDPTYIRGCSGYDHPEMDESAGAFLYRANHSTELILSKKESKVLVVTHGHMIRELLNNLLKLKEKTRFPHANCGLSCVEVGDVLAVKFINQVICSNKALQRQAAECGVMRCYDHHF